MLHVAKLLILDHEGHHLLLYRDNHPYFGDDPDLPGGTLEAGEEPIDTMVREVFEEAGIVINPQQVTAVYAGTDYSHNGGHYSLFRVQLTTRPDVTLSWEHATHQWLPEELFLEKAKHAKDRYMHMVYEQLVTGPKANT